MQQTLEMTRRDKSVQQCIDNCIDCHAICLETVPHCLKEGGEHAEPGHIGLLLDCADICRTSADFMLRGSEYHSYVCGACAEVCERCAEDCDRIGRGDEQMSACANLCRQCAESCRSMASGN